MEMSEILRLRLLSQQQALNAAISSLRAVTGTTAAGASELSPVQRRQDGSVQDAACTEPHAPQESQSKEAESEQRLFELDGEFIDPFAATTDSGKDPMLLAVEGGENSRK